MTPDADHRHLGGEQEPTSLDPYKALVRSVARMRRGSGRVIRLRPRNPDEVATLALQARGIGREGLSYSASTT